MHGCLASPLRVFIFSDRVTDVKICFVGRRAIAHDPIHDNLLHILQQIGDVTALYPPQPDVVPDPIATAVQRATFDLYLFWQSDEIASRLLPAIGDRRIVVVPQDDAVRERSPHWWQQFQTHQFACFSRKAHEMLLRAGLHSSYFQYFPPPVPTPGLRYATAAFCWQGQAGENQDIQKVAEICRMIGATELYTPGTGDYPEAIDFPVTRIATDRQDLMEQAAASCGFVILPPHAGGFDPFFLQAMARGQIVVAPDSALVNDYIGHQSSGILYPAENLLAVSRLSNDDMDRISASARSRIRLGHERWQRDQGRLKSILMDDGKRWSYSDYAASFGNLLRQEAHKRTLQIN